MSLPSQIFILRIDTDTFFLTSIYISLVSRERIFSKLNIIKMRLRASLGSDKLETFMLISSEKDILDSVSADDLIHVVTKDLQAFFK